MLQKVLLKTPLNYHQEAFQQRSLQIRLILKGVLRALNDLQSDIGKVTGHSLSVKAYNMRVIIYLFVIYFCIKFSITL